MAVGRNEACSCGSGRKYKKCCARAERTALSPAALVLGLLLLIGVTATIMATLNAPPTEPSPGRVWSEEHGHWHDLPGARDPDAAPVPQPPGPVPPGKVWSAEHGHWHDAP
jgi:hypothetical protein